MVRQTTKWKNLFVYSVRLGNRGSNPAGVGAPSDLPWVRSVLDKMMLAQGFSEHFACPCRCHSTHVTDTTEYTSLATDSFLKRHTSTQKFRLHCTLCRPCQDGYLAIFPHSSTTLRSTIRIIILHPMSRLRVNGGIPLLPLTSSYRSRKGSTLTGTGWRTAANMRRSR